jgi:hypothetical protein
MTYHEAQLSNQLHIRSVAHRGGTDQYGNIGPAPYLKSSERWFRFGMDWGTEVVVACWTGGTNHFRLRHVTKFRIHRFYRNLINLIGFY